MHTRIDRLSAIGPRDTAFCGNHLCVNLLLETRDSAHYELPEEQTLRPRPRYCCAKCAEQARYLAYDGSAFEHLICIRV